MGLSNLLTDMRFVAGSGQNEGCSGLVAYMSAFVFSGKSLCGDHCMLSENIVISGHVVKG